MSTGRGTGSGMEDADGDTRPDRQIPDPGFAGDTGATDPAVQQAMAAYAADPREGYVGALAAVAASRLLVPVVAVLGEVEHDEQGLAHDKSSDMATVLVQGRDGRMALLAFTGTESLTAWDPQARPVPVASRLAAQSALQEGAAALVVDIAGPRPLVVEGDDLRGLALGCRLARAGSAVVWLRGDGGSAEEPIGPSGE